MVHTDGKWSPGRSNVWPLRAAGRAMAAPLYHDINDYKGRYSKTNRISRLLADGLGTRHKDQRLTDKKLSPGN